MLCVAGAAGAQVAVVHCVGTIVQGPVSPSDQRPGQQVWGDGVLRGRCWWEGVGGGVHASLNLGVLNGRSGSVDVWFARSAGVQCMHVRRHKMQPSKDDVVSVALPQLI